MPLRAVLLVALGVVIGFPEITLWLPKAIF
jgi:hypothetical protein